MGLSPSLQAVVPPPDGAYPGFNTAEGQSALFSLTPGAGNTAIGAYSLFAVTVGSYNTATGLGEPLFNTSDYNTATGAGALLSNTNGNSNTALGVNSLQNNTTGSFNIALGVDAGYSISGSGNVCIGQGVSGQAGVDDSTYIRNVNTTQQSPATDVVLLLFVCRTADLGTSLQ